MCQLIICLLIYVVILSLLTEGIVTKIIGPDATEGTIQMWTSIYLIAALGLHLPALKYIYLTENESTQSEIDNFYLGSIFISKIQLLCLQSAYTDFS